MNQSPETTNRVAGSVFGTVVQAGNIGVVHIERVEPRSPANWPHQVGMIPTPAQCFQRRAETARLERTLVGGGTAVLGQVGDLPTGGVLAGMGGVGKTQLAANHARTAWQAGAVDVLVWITASDATAVVAGYAQAGAELLGADPADPEAAAAAFLAWLEPKVGQRCCRWLVVLDDVTDPVDLRGWWPPASPTGSTVVTTRRKDAALAGGGRLLIEVGVFTEADSLTYLTEVLSGHDRREPDAELAALATALGHLPLALSQAVAYLVDVGMDCGAYRTLLADRARALADAAPDVLPDDQAQTVAAAWAVSIDRADALRPAGLARPMLELAAVLDPNGIPDAVLTSPPALDYLTSRRGAEPVTPDQARLAVRTLHRLSLINHDADSWHREVRVHQLIQRAVRDTLTLARRDSLARAAAHALVVSWPEVERDTQLAQVLRGNAAALTACADEALYRPNVHLVLFHAGHSLGEGGQVTAARDYFHRLAGIAAARVGADHPDTLRARRELVTWRGLAGDAAGAATACGELVDDLLRVLGPDHADTLTARHLLCQLRGEAGDAAGAAEALAVLVADALRVLGPDHPDTLTDRHELARWQGHAGDSAGAVAALADLVADYLRVFGPDHPETFTLRSNLARSRGEAGDPAAAVGAFAELLADRVRVLGPDHPRTLRTRHELALWRGEAGDAAGAADAFAALTEDASRALGPDHPDTLTARLGGAVFQGREGDITGAATAMTALLEDYLRVLGPDHSESLTARHNLAVYQGKLGDAAGAVVAFDELLADRVRLHGPDHPHIFRARRELARWRGHAGNPAAAASELAELLADQLRVQGPDHPETRRTQDELAHWPTDPPSN